MDEQIIINTITELETARCRALETGDLKALAELVDEGLVHIHATGTIDDKAGYLQLVQDAIEFLRVDRKNLDVRVYADVAIATGRLLQSIKLRATGERREMDVITTQIWLRQADVWRQISFQATNL
ncbi:nuclear transport factor 2 family protein [Pseudomonas sp. PAMC 29040]|uniref:nuclear transport factor 2 family protein n=1 Tax=Pseudomonas sp. PAMC 29040 TaxID=2498450 RepID=UPI000FB0C6EA|nr:nuclear transport factor 2 family protein [Pseudomonas sp. PAMC 29040]RUT42403.1 nuclear transport factor 2 family protein [Pseudomonas sp. PAMC 29040]